MGASDTAFAVGGCRSSRALAGHRKRTVETVSQCREIREELENIATYLVNLTSKEIRLNNAFNLVDSGSIVKVAR